MSFLIDRVEETPWSTHIQCRCRRLNAAKLEGLRYINLSIITGDRRHTGASKVAARAVNLGDECLVVGFLVGGVRAAREEGLYHRGQDVLLRYSCGIEPSSASPDAQGAFILLGSPHFQAGLEL